MTLSTVLKGVLLTLASSLASAQAAMHNGKEVQGTSGWLHVSGGMQEPACRVAMASRWQTISLPSVGTDTLLNPGDRAETTPFFIRLEGCLRAAGAVSDRNNNTVLWSDWQPIATLTFSGEADANVRSLFAVMGVKGVGLRLQDARGKAVLPGVKGHPLYLTPGENVLYYKLTPERTTAELQAGHYTAVLDFKIDYQ